MNDIVHMNFCIGSDGDITYIPICEDPKQGEPVLKIIAKPYERVILMIANNLTLESGEIYCYTQQIPN